MQEKLDGFWKLKEGDELKGKKIASVKYFDNEQTKSTEKLFVLDDGSEWMLTNDGLHKVESSGDK
jgi:hypothetical protein